MRANRRELFVGIRRRVVQIGSPATRIVGTYKIILARAKFAKPESETRFRRQGEIALAMRAAKRDVVVVKTDQRQMWNYGVRLRRAGFIYEMDVIVGKL